MTGIGSSFSASVSAAPKWTRSIQIERVYWLDIGGPAGPRVSDVDAAPRFDLTPPAHFLSTVRAEEVNWHWALESLTIATEDTWYWGRLQPLGAGQAMTETYSGIVPDPAPGFDASLRLEEVARAYGTHRSMISFNGGAPLVDTTWQGRALKLFTATVPASALVAGQNNVQVGAWNDPAVTAAASPSLEQMRTAGLDET